MDNQVIGESSLFSKAKEQRKLQKSHQNGFSPASKFLKSVWPRGATTKSWILKDGTQKTRFEQYK